MIIPTAIVYISVKLYHESILFLSHFYLNFSTFEGKVVFNMMTSYNTAVNQFIGRSRERALFDSWLDNPEAPLTIVTVTGISGVGKSTLLSEFMRMASDKLIMSLWLDGRTFTPTPVAFIEYLSTTISLESLKEQPAYPLQPLIEASSDTRVLLCIDNYEDLRILERWFTEAFIPKFSPRGIMIMLASRPKFNVHWHTNPLLKAHIHDINLTNFTMEETASYITSVGNPLNDQLGNVFRMTEGHPLALALTVEAVENQDLLLDEKNPIVSQHISANLLRELTQPRLQPVIDVLTVLQTANQELLSLATGSPITIHEYQTLQELSFIRSTPHGISLHDVARLHLLRDFKLREPNRLQQLRQHILQIMYTIHQTSDKPSGRYLARQMLLLCKDALPLLNTQYVDISVEPTSFDLKSFRSEDLPALHHILSEWCEYSIDPWQTDDQYHQLLDELSIRYPESISVLRDEIEHPIGLSITVLLHRETYALLEQFFPYEIAECFSRDELDIDPDEADTYYAVLIAATNERPGYTREELIGHLSLDRLSYLGEGNRAILVATNANLKQFLKQLGFQVQPPRIRYSDTPYAKAEVLTLDLRVGNFGDWVMSFLANTMNSNPSITIDSKEELTDHHLRKMLSILRFPSKLESYTRFVSNMNSGVELQALLHSYLEDEDSELSQADRNLLHTAFIASPGNPNAAAHLCNMSRATFYRYLRDAITNFRYILSNK